MALKSNIQQTGASYGHSDAVCGELGPYVTAAGSTQATATLLPRLTRHIVTAGTGGVIIPPGVGRGDSLQFGDEIEITNATLSAINVYPPLGYAFLGSATNAALSLSPQFSLSVLVDSASRMIARYYAVNSGTSGTGTVTISGILDGGGSAIASGTKIYIYVDYACTIQQVTCGADQSGSCPIDIWKCTYAQFDAGGTHPVSGDKITASTPPAISGSTKYQDSTLTGWTTSIAAGSWLALVTTGATTSITRATVALKVVKT